MSSVPDETWAILVQNQPTGEFANDLPGWMTSWRLLNGDRPFDDSLAESYTRTLYEGDPRNAMAADNHVHAMTTVPRNLVNQLRTVELPLLVIHGSKDPLVPIDHGEVTAQLVSHSQLERLEGAGHMFFNKTAWDEIAQRIVAFIQRAELGQ